MSTPYVDLLTLPVEELAAKLDRLNARARIMVQLSEAKALTLPADVLTAIDTYRDVLRILLAVATAAETIPEVLH